MIKYLRFLTENKINKRYIHIHTLRLHQRYFGRGRRKRPLPPPPLAPSRVSIEAE